MPARGLKKHMPDFSWDGNKVSPDEIDRYEYYTVINPSIDITWFGTVAGTSTQAKAIVAKSKIADYPRNIRVSMTLASGSATGGTAILNGKDQFGEVITETFAIATAANGGTAIGTKVFSEFTSGTVTFGTSDAGNATCNVGVGTAGTTTLFGLPTKIGGTTDIKRINGSFTGTGTSTVTSAVFGGTPSSAAVTATHAFKAPADVPAGTVIYNVQYKPSYDNQDGGNPIANW
jgi:hypothetical protein